MGRKGLDIYKYCENKFELLGRNNTLIQEHSPFCINNINEFFCKYEVTELKRKSYRKAPRTCADQQALKLILTMIKKRMY